MKPLFAFFCLYIFTALSYAQTQRGEASYYKDIFEGRKTASGEIFQQSLSTAAHRTLAFGTIVQVTNLINGKSAKVRINDRGPYIRNRIIDVSKSVAYALDFVKEGVVLVEIEVVGFSDENPESIDIDTASFEEELAMETPDEEKVSYKEVDKETDNQGLPTKIEKPTQPEQKESIAFAHSDKAEKSRKEIEKEIREESKIKEEKLKSGASKKKATKTAEEADLVHNEVVDLVGRVTSKTETGENDDAKEFKQVEKKVEKPKATKPSDEVVSKAKKEAPKEKPVKQENKSEKKETQEGVADIANKIIGQAQQKVTTEQLFNLNAERIKPNFMAIQVSSLSDATNAIELGRILKEFYKKEVSLYYKYMNSKPLYSIAIGKVDTREEAELLLEEIKDRYPYAFILDLKNKANLK